MSDGSNDTFGRKALACYNEIKLTIAPESASISIMTPFILTDTTSRCNNE